MLIQHYVFCFCEMTVQCYMPTFILRDLFFLLICRIFFLISSYLLDTDPLLIIGIADSFSHFVDSALHFKVFICINYSLYLAPSLSCLGNIFLCQDYIDMKL